MTGPVALVLSPSQVEGLVEECVRRALARLPAAPSGPLWMTTEEAADYLRCKPQRIHELVSRGDLTRNKEGGRLLLRRAEVEALVVRAR